MDLYIDKQNLVSFIQEQNNPEHKNVYEDCFRMLMRQLHIVYNFEKSPQLLEDDVLKPYFMLSGQGLKDSERDTFLPSKFPDRPIKSCASNQFNSHQHSAVYLVDDEKTTFFSEKSGSLVGGVGDEIQTLKRLFCGEDYDFHKIYNIQDSESFPCWDQLLKDKLCLPLSDIIIMDRYIGMQEELSQYNIFKLVDVLIEHAHGEVNLVIFCDRSYYSRDLKEVIIPNWNSFKTHMKSLIKQKTGKGGNVTIVFFPKSSKSYDSSNKKKNEHPHDRSIFTNYMMYRSGDSFLYFNSKNEMISEGISLDANSLAKKSNFDFAMSFIHQAQSLYEKIRLLNNSDMIIGDKKSNYIKF